MCFKSEKQLQTQCKKSQQQGLLFFQCLTRLDDDLGLFQHWTMFLEGMHSHSIAPAAPVHATEGPTWRQCSISYPTLFQSKLCPHLAHKSTAESGLLARWFGFWGFFFLMQGIREFMAFNIEDNPAPTWESSNQEKSTKNVFFKRRIYLKPMV